MNGNITPLADNVSFEAAAANEAFACVMNSFERYGVYPGETVLIIGAGAIGMMHAALAFMSGATKVILNDLSEDRLAKCKELEPRLIIVSGDPAETVNAETDGNGVDVVITACSVASVQEAAPSYSALNGRVNLFGGLPKGKTADLDTNIIHYKQLLVSGTTRSSHEQFRKTLDFIAKKLVDVDSLVTHRFSIDEIDQAIENASKQQGLKQAVVFE
jgi:L-iditol 2-dehydrogenase